MEAKKYIFIIIFFLLSFLSADSALAVAIGISPPEIDAPHVLKGGSGVSETIHVSVSDSTKDTYIRVEPSGEYADSISGPETLFIPAGSQSKDYTFTINPLAAAVGDYETHLNFYHENPQPAAEEKGGNAVTVISGATAVIRFSVTGEQILEYSVANFNVRESEIGAPLYISYVVNNTGNVQWKPDRIEITFQDAVDQTNVKTMEISEKSIPLSKAGAIEEASIKTDHALIEAKYAATAKFFYQEKKVAELTSQKFNIYPTGTLDQKGELMELNTNKREYSPGENIKLEAPFINTSNLTLEAVLITEIYDAESSMVDLRRGQTVEIEPGAEMELSEIFNLNKEGTYTISAYVEYGNKKTSTLDTEIVIQGNNSFFQSLKGSYLLIFIISAIIITGALIYRRRKSNKQQANLNNKNN